MTFNEDTRVKIPAILTLTRLGYDYISLKGRDDIDQETNIFKDIFFKNIRKLNPSVEETNIQKFFQKIQLMLDNDDLGKEFYQNLIKPTDIKFIDWEHIENNQLNVCTELTYGNMCQEQKAIRAGQFLRTSEKNLLYRGLIICGVTNRQCPCELKKDVFSYVACWRKDKTRIYIREEEFTKQIRSILNRIKLPDCIIIELQKELKTAKASERKFCAEEIARLKTEQAKLKQKMDILFDMRLDGELDRETFDLKRNELQVRITRLNNKIVAHEKADNSFDETILGLLDIATQAGYIFEKSSNVDLKRLLLKFVFENITLTEGQISYKLRFPFNEFANLTTPKKNKPTSYEPTPSLINQSVLVNNNQNVQSGYMNFCEPQFTDKNQGVTLKNATPLQSGWGGWIRTNE